MSIKRDVEKFKNGEMSLEEYVKSYIDNIKQKNRDINALIFFDEDYVYSQIEKLKEKQNKGEKLGKLFGIPIVIKDNINVFGLKTTCASKILANYESIYDATVIEKIKAEDGIILAKANMDEFAMGSSNETSYFGPVKNPLDLERVPGGSSGGSAAAVSSGMAPIALGSDTGGSIRQPAAFCGVIGLKPTYGRVSRYGLVAFGSSLDQIGPIADDVEDAAYLLEVIAGYDPKDSTSIEKEVESYSNLEDIDVKSLKVGVPKEYFIDGVDKEVIDAVNERIEYLKSLGIEVKEISLPHTEYAVATYYIIATAEASSNLARYDGVKYGYRSQNYTSLIDMYKKTRDEGFGAEVKRRIMLGTYVLSAGYYDAYYLKGQKVRTLIIEDFKKVFEDVDLIITPVSPSLPFKLGEKLDDPLQMYLSDMFTIPASLAGLPAISVRAGKIGNLYGAVQIIGNYFEEKKVLALAKLLDKRD